MTYLTHFLALLAGVWCGISFALWVVAYKGDTVSKILNHTHRG